MGTEDSVGNGNDIENRLRTCAESCVAAYVAWRDADRSGGRQESLQDSIHELRKITARLEIEIAVSERREQTVKPIPIPAHRASRPRHAGSDQPDFDFNTSDDSFSHQGDSDSQPSRPNPPRRRRPMPHHGNNRPSGNPGTQKPQE